VARKNSRVEYYLSIKRICLAILPHSDISVFHTFFFFVFSFFFGGGGRSLLGNIHCTPLLYFLCLAGTTCPFSCFVSQMTSQGS
jgi:hypothetical protein